MTDVQLKNYFPYKIEKLFNLRQHQYELEKAKGGPAYPQYFKNWHSKTNSNVLTKEEEYKNNYIIDTFLSWRNWYEGGKTIFSFSPDLLKLLQLTDVDDVTPDNFYLPYEHFYISFYDLGLIAKENSSKIIEGVYVWNDRSEIELDSDYNCVLHFHFAGDFLDLFMETVGNYTEFGSGEQSAKFWDFSLFFIEKENKNTVKAVVQDAIDLFKYIYLPHDNEEPVTNEHTQLLNTHIEFIGKTIKLVINCLLYLSLPKDETDIIKTYPADLPHGFLKKLKFAKTKNEAEKIEKKIRASGFSKILLVGNSFAKHTSKTVSGLQVSPHWRRGHWRKQRHGTRLTECKLKWIRPTIVNNQLGMPEKGHIYVDKK